MPFRDLVSRVTVCPLEEAIQLSAPRVVIYAEDSCLRLPAALINQNTY